MTATPVARLAQWPAAAPALAWPGGKMSYGRLRDRVDALADIARRSGPAGSPLAVQAGSRLGTVLGVLAGLSLDRPVLPLDPARPDRAACLAACAPGGLLDPDAGTVTPLAGGEAAAPGLSADQRPALLVPTSGTSGAARVAMLTAAAMDAHVAASAQVLPPFGSAGRWLVCLPMTSIGALAALWRALSAGGCFALLEGFEASAAGQLMARGTSHVSLVPAMIPPLAESRAASRELRCVLTGGGPLSARMAELALAAGWPLWNAWGMTETASHVAAGPVEPGWREGVVGQPLPGVTIRVESDGGRLVLGGPMLMSGYAAPGLAPGAGLAGDGYYTSGDLGERLADGRLRVLGRADDVLVTGGVNVHPEIVERQLSACAGAGEIAVTARPDHRWGMTLVALYTGTAPVAALEAWARASLPPAARPRVFARVPALPRNAMGKLLRHELPALIPSNS